MALLDAASVGLIVGFLGRAGPEVLKFVDRHLDRRHELAMQDKALAFEQLRGANGWAKDRLDLDVGNAAAAMDMWKLSLEQQFNTGNPWLNAISILVRPTTTAVLVWVYVAVKIVMICAALHAPDVMKALVIAYGDMDTTILAGILAFWFADRGLFRSGGK